MDTEIKNAVNAADTDAQYDEKAKRLLGNKTILAHILVKTVDEFWGVDESSMAYVHLMKDDILGSYQWEGGLDLLNIIMVGIADELPRHDDKYELHRLLSAILSMELSVDEKLGIMETEYGIPLNDKMREDVVIMCNLSQGIREKGRAESEEKIILNMYRNNFTFEQIALATGKSMEEIDAVIKSRDSVLA
ncbi:MAG: hypothetical protein NC337_13225 [Roseburia sp.]|nr:hypothetical protein [Roseburia sp.]